MSVFLIRPMVPSTSKSGLVSVQYPINIGYLSAYLKERGVACHVRDYEVEPFEDQDFLKVIRQNGVKVVGFSCMTPHILSAGRMAALVKKYFPEVLVVLGGVHGSAIPCETLDEFPGFDVVVCGEGEETMLELYKTWEAKGPLHKVKGIVYRDALTGEIRFTEKRPYIEDLDSLPFPDRDMVNISKYAFSHVSRGFSRKVINIAEFMCSRGCPFHCTYCASKVIHSTKVRFRSPENIIQEMQSLIDRYDINHFSFLDDTFTLKLSLMKPVCDFMREKGVTFDCFSRVNTVDEEKLALMVQSGCKKISYGVESGSQKMLDLMRKGIKVDEVRQAFKLSRQAGVGILEGTFMIGGHPDETMEDIMATKDLIFEVKPDILGLFITIPYPGTEHNKILKERGLLDKENWEEFTLFFGDPSWELGGEVTMAQRKELMHAIIRQYYTSPGFILRTLRGIKSPCELMYWVKLGFDFLQSVGRRKG